MPAKSRIPAAQVESVALETPAARWAQATPVVVPPLKSKKLENEAGGSSIHQMGLSSPQKTGTSKPAGSPYFKRLGGTIMNYREDASGDGSLPSAILTHRTEANRQDQEGESGKNSGRGPSMFGQYKLSMAQVSPTTSIGGGGVQHANSARQGVNNLATIAENDDQTVAPLESQFDSNLKLLDSGE